MTLPVYVTLEGPEGCGKSTQAERLATDLNALLTRETGGTPIGRRLRDILHDVTVEDLAVGDTWPNLVILLDADDDVLASRMKERELDRFERAGDEFHQRVRSGFAQMAAADPTRWVVIDAAAPPDDIARQIRSAISERLGI
jgi:thymidylate kinase